MVLRDPSRWFYDRTSGNHSDSEDESTISLGDASRHKPQVGAGEPATEAEARTDRSARCDLTDDRASCTALVAPPSSLARMKPAAWLQPRRGATRRRRAGPPRPPTAATAYPAGGPPPAGRSATGGLRARPAAPKACSGPARCRPAATLAAVTISGVRLIESEEAWVSAAPAERRPALEPVRSPARARFGPCLARDRSARPARAGTRSGLGRRSRAPARLRPRPYSRSNGLVSPALAFALFAVRAT